MEQDALKIRPDLWYGLICALPPQEYRDVVSLIGVANELVAPEFPYSKDLYIVVAWQQGFGTFQFHMRITDEDGNVLGETDPFPVVMELLGNQLTLPYKFIVHTTGTYLFEGFLDGEATFKTILRISRRAQ